MYVKTHVMMLHSEFCAVCSSLSDVAAKIFLIDIHIICNPPPLAQTSLYSALQFLWVQHQEKQIKVV